MNVDQSSPALVLLAGLWLPRTVWDDVTAELARLGRRTIVPPLAGVDADSATATLDDQLDAVLDAVDSVERPILVGHSAAATLAWLAADLDADARARLAARTHPVPEGVARGRVRLNDERRFEVPVTLVCPEFDPEQARGWVASGEIGELARARSVAYVDIDSGHWPMVTRPVELARLLDAVGRVS